jgi:hypothetical protein
MEVNMMNDKKILLGVLMASCSVMAMADNKQNMTSTSGSGMQMQQTSTSSSAQSSEGSNVYLTPAWQYLISHWGNGGKQKGSMGGISAGYAYLERDSLYFNGEFTFMAGKLHGSAGTSPTQEYITEVDFGYDISSPFGEKFTLTPFVGVGAYVFNQTGPGPVFDSHFWYVPIGASLEYRFDQSWSMALVGYGAPTFAGHWSQSGDSGHAPVSGLWKAELPVTYLGSLPFELSLIPFVKGWAYEKHGDLIKQRQTYYGLKMSFGYHF